MSWYELWVREQLSRIIWAVAIVATIAGCALWLYGCGGASPKAQSAADTEAACMRAVDALTAKRDAGVPCPLAKAEVALQEPECPLVFTCKEEKRR